MTDLAAVEQLQQCAARMTAQIGRVIVGQQSVVEELLIALIAGGHTLLVGVPGLAKTMMVQTLAETVGLTFNRVQFTPDLMPADITGTEVIQEDRATGRREFRFLPGPIFANVILADEINRTPPKTQAALLEAMQEQAVTAGGLRHRLPDPFFVLATQNPIEQEGTYPLPEAQLDRFMFQVFVKYPTEDEEFEIVRQTTAQQRQPVEAVVSQAELASMQELVRKIPVADPVIRYALALVRPTRDPQTATSSLIKDYVSWGAGPRASQFLVLGAKARAALQGRPFVSPDDIRAVAPPVLRHRILLNFRADADRITSDDIIQALMDQTPEYPPLPDDFPKIFGNQTRPERRKGMGQ